MRYSKDPKLYAPEKLFVKLRPAYSVKLVFSHVVKGIKIKITAKFRDAEHLRFEDTKRIMSPEKLRDFRETGPWARGHENHQVHLHLHVLALGNVPLTCG